MEPDLVAAAIGNREVLIWGTGDVGLDVLTSLRRSGVRVIGFLHTRPEGTAHGLPIFPVLRGLEIPATGPRPFVVIATTHFRKMAETTCQEAGQIKGKDYLTYLAIRRPMAVIEIANHLGPIEGYGCFRPTPRIRRDMTPEQFHAILTKLLTDQPNLCHVELSWLGDPLANPWAPEIIQLCEKHIPCTVTTTLTVAERLDDVIAAKPSRINLVAYGTGESYNRSMGGLAWTDFLIRFDRLKALRAPQDKIRVAVKYVRTQSADPADVETWRQLTKGHDIHLLIEAPYAMPYDTYALYRDTGARPATLDDLTWNLDEALALSIEDKDNPCLSQRIFPVIDADGSAGACHLFASDRLTDDYLKTDWASLLDLRRTCPLCTHCQSHGLHRLDIAVLAERHPTSLTIL